jgi:hypothetical protein
MGFSAFVDMGSFLSRSERPVESVRVASADLGAGPKWRAQVGKRDQILAGWPFAGKGRPAPEA